MTREELERLIGEAVNRTLANLNGPDGPGRRGSDEGEETPSDPAPEGQRGNQNASGSENAGGDAEGAPESGEGEAENENRGNTPVDVNAVVDGVLDRLGRGQRQAGNAPNLVPEQVANAAVTGARVTGEPETDGQRIQHTVRFFTGMTRGDRFTIAQAQQELARIGEYGTRDVAAGDAYNTFTDADGGFLLPTSVRAGIEAVAEEFGVIRGQADTFTHVTGDIKVNASNNGVVFNAVAEGAEIASSKNSFSSITLNPQKWAAIVPYTFEINEEAGAQVISDIQRAIGIGAARAEDDTGFNGDGTAAYNGVTGIFNDGGVPTYTMGAGSVDFSDISAEDVFLSRNLAIPGTRMTAGYVAHPDMEAIFRNMRNGDGTLLYMFNSDDRPNTLGGRPVYYTEALPDQADSAISTSFLLWGDLRFWKVAFGPNMSSEELREGTIQASDPPGTGAPINLATMDARALKVREFFDMGTNFPGAFVQIETAAA